MAIFNCYVSSPEGKSLAATGSKRDPEMDATTQFRHGIDGKKYTEKAGSNDWWLVN